MTWGPGVRVSLKLAHDLIVDARFETCALDVARPVAEAMCGLLVGATIDDASHLSVIDVAQVGGVGATTPAARTVHYAKSAALLPHLGRRAGHGASLTCACFHVPTETIVAAIRKHRVRTVEELKLLMPVTTGCGTCRPEVQRLIDARDGERD